MALDLALRRLHETADERDFSRPWTLRVRARLRAVAAGLASEQDDEPDAGPTRLEPGLGVRQASATDAPSSDDGWLSPRTSATGRRRERLLAQVDALGGMLPQLSGPSARIELRRLLVDLDHYQQRVHDLAYDTMHLDLGGSE